MFNVKWSQTIFSSRQHYSTFPWVAKLPGNKVLIAFRKAGLFSVKAALEGRPSHHDNDSEAATLLCEIQGDRIQVRHETSVRLPTCGINDPALSVLRDGSVLMRFTGIELRQSAERGRLSGKLLAHRTDLGTVSGVIGNFICRSLDEGITWSNPELIECDSLTASFSRDPVVELKDGTWLLPLYRSNPNSTETAWVVRSFDKGKTWGDPALIAQDERGAHSMFRGTNFNECSILELPNGRLLAMVRADETQYGENGYLPIGGLGSLKQAYSDNGGLSWSHLSDSGIWGQPANVLFANSEDKTILTYGFRKPPMGIGVALGDANGVGWAPQQFLIRDGASCVDFGYPCTCQIGENEFLTCYYWPQADGTRSIEATLWGLAK